LPRGLGLVDVAGFLQARDESLPGLPVTVIDVRDAEAYRDESIPGAVNLPLAKILEGVGEIPAEPLRTS
jgi:rhodanese-related sulfurtransferase